MMTGAEFVSRVSASHCAPATTAAPPALFPGVDTPLVQAHDQPATGLRSVSPDLPMAASFPGQTLHVGPSVCTGCSQPILDQFVLQVDGHAWHSACLRCHVCHAPLRHVCYSGNSRLLCQDDFFRMFGATCSACRDVIAPSAVVCRAHDNVYHQECFRCSVCKRELCTGDEFYLSQDGLLCCKEDFMARKKEEERAGDGSRGSESSHTDSTKSSYTNQESRNLQSLQERQRLLHQKFAENPRPSRSEIEALATLTRMDSAGLRLWFRKHRAKMKKKGNNHEFINDNDGIYRVHAPNGSCPLPIVNRALSTDCPPDTASTVNHSANSAHLSKCPAPRMTVWDELWSDDFVPPNVDLRPDQFKDGEIVLYPLNDPQHGPELPQGSDLCHPQGRDLCQGSGQENQGPQYQCSNQQLHQPSLYQGRLPFACTSINTNGVTSQGGMDGVEPTTETPGVFTGYQQQTQCPSRQQEINLSMNDNCQQGNNNVMLTSPSVDPSSKPAKVSLTPNASDRRGSISHDTEVMPHQGSARESNRSDRSNVFHSVFISGSVCSVPSHLVQQQQQGQQQHQQQHQQHQQQHQQQIYVPFLQSASS